MTFQFATRLTLTTLFVAGLCVASAQAKTISVNVYRNGSSINDLNAIDVAGVVPVANWNNVFNIGSYIESTGNGLKDDSGVATSMNFSVNGRAGNSEEKITTSGNPNASMMTGQGVTSIRPVSGSEGEIVAQAQFTNALAELGPNYDVYIYYGIGFSGDFMGGAGTFILSSGEYTAGANGTDPMKSDVPSSTVVTSKGYATMRGTNAGLGTDPTWNDAQGFVMSTGQAVNQKGNYVLFEDVNIADLVITMDPNAVGYQWNQNSFLGFQLVGSASVPEPSTFVLATMGLVGLVGYGLRRRKS